MCCQDIANQLVASVTGFPWLFRIGLRLELCVEGSRDLIGAFDRLLPFLREFLCKFDGSAATPCAQLNFGKQFTIEDVIQVTIHLDDSGFTALKVGFRQFCFYEQIAPSHVDLGAIDATTAEGNAGFPAEFRISIGRDAHHQTQVGFLGYPRSAEDAHQ